MKPVFVIVRIQRVYGHGDFVDYRVLCDHLGWFPTREDAEKEAATQDRMNGLRDWEVVLLPSPLTKTG
jgi:hypothetical protein